MSMYSMILKHSSTNDDFLEHYGVMGMHWGIRRYQNADGSLTAAGKSHYNVKTSDKKHYSLTDDQKKTIKKATKIGAICVATALASYGTYKLASTGQLSKAVAAGKLFISNATKTVKNEAKDWKSIRKQASKEWYKGLKEGVTEGSFNSGKTLSKAMSGGITWMAGIEVADLMTNGAATQTILTAYNDHVKKDNRVKTSYRNSKKNDDDDD